MRRNDRQGRRTWIFAGEDGGGVEDVNGVPRGGPGRVRGVQDHGREVGEEGGAEECDGRVRRADGDRDRGRCDVVVDQTVTTLKGARGRRGRREGGGGREARETGGREEDRQRPGNLAKFEHFGKKM